MSGTLQRRRQPRFRGSLQGARPAHVRTWRTGRTLRRTHQCLSGQEPQSVAGGPAAHRQVDSPAEPLFPEGLHLRAHGRPEAGPLLAEADPPGHRLHPVVRSPPADERVRRRAHPHLCRERYQGAAAGQGTPDVGIRCSHCRHHHYLPRLHRRPSQETHEDLAGCQQQAAGCLRPARGNHQGQGAHRERAAHCPRDPEAHAAPRVPHAVAMSTSTP